MPKAASTNTTPKRRASRKSAFQPVKTEEERERDLTARLAQIRADLIAGNGPYLRKDAPIRPSPDDKLVRLCFEFLDVAARLAHYRRAPSAR
jgi:hypothetical protein